MPKVYRTYNSQTDMLDIPTSFVNGMLNIAITTKFGTADATTVTFPVRADVAQILVKGLYDGMQLSNPSAETPFYRVEP